jgi:hypothetical protein
MMNGAGYGRMWSRLILTLQLSPRRNKENHENFNMYRRSPNLDLKSGTTK